MFFLPAFSPQLPPERDRGAGGGDPARRGWHRGGGDSARWGWHRGGDLATGGSIAAAGTRPAGDGIAEGTWPPEVASRRGPGPPEVASRRRRLGPPEVASRRLGSSPPGMAFDALCYHLQPAGSHRRQPDSDTLPSTHGMDLSPVVRADLRKRDTPSSKRDQAAQKG